MGKSLKIFTSEAQDTMHRVLSLCWEFRRLNHDKNVGTKEFASEKWKNNQSSSEEMQ